MNHKILKYLIFLIFSTNFDISHANLILSVSVPETLISQQILNTTTLSIPNYPNPNVRFLLAGILSFFAAVISSAGGIGGGGLFIPILTIVAGLDLKMASSYSAFMVTGGSIANVACHMLAKGNAKAMIDYDIALLSEPCMLLGVSLGVIFNLMLPEWLITILFVVFIATCTFKTFKSGVFYWRLETEGVVMRRSNVARLENGEGSFGESTKMPLLSEGVGEGRMGIPVVKVGMLVVIWFSFLLLYLLRGNRYGQGIIEIEACGTGYWIISAVQIPLAVIFTSWILYSRKFPKNDNTTSTQQGNGGGTRNLSPEFIFPVMALLAGVLGGVFGIGGGMLISPLLLQLGIGPEVTAATCSFMVLFSSTMSAIQYLLLGMEHIYGAVAFAAICFVASLVGLTIVQQAIMKHGRASLIVFSVGTVMALSTVLMTSFGAADVWRDYKSGQSMGFKKPC